MVWYGIRTIFVITCSRLSPPVNGGDQINRNNSIKQYYIQNHRFTKAVNSGRLNCVDFVWGKSSTPSWSSPTLTVIATPPFSPTLPPRPPVSTGSLCSSLFCRKPGQPSRANFKRRVNCSKQPRGEGGLTPLVYFARFLHPCILPSPDPYALYV